MSKLNYNKTLKVGVYLDQLALPIDPSNNPNLTNAFFSNNLYSNLVDVDENNNYTNELVSKYWFETEANKLYFEFKNSRVSAEDAAFSLKRLIMQNRQLHTDFWNIICKHGEAPRNCADRIYVENKNLVIHYDDAVKSTYIIPTLASVDYKIIPLAAFDSNDLDTAKIVNYKLTSGYYHLEVRDSKYFFVKNSNSLQNIYNEYELINANANSILEDSFVEQIDILSTTVVLQNSAYQKLIEKNWNIFKTHNISILMLIFSKNGISKTTVAERFNVAQRLVKESLNLVQLVNSKRTIEFFQEYGQGFLTQAQRAEIEDLRNQATPMLQKKIIYGTWVPQKWSSFAQNNSDIVIVENKTFQMNMKEEDQPDMFIISNDVSFDLNLSLISYAANVGLLSMTKSQVDYFAGLSNELEKIEYLNAIHFKTLKECKIYPMVSSPYHTAFNGKFEHNLSKFNSRTLLWKIH